MLRVSGKQPQTGRLILEDREMAKVDTTGLDIAIAQYEKAIAFEIANPFDGKISQAIPYCFIPSAVKARIEDGTADYLEEIQNLLAAAKRAKAGA